jgi:hypothetical protein
MYFNPNMTVSIDKGLRVNFVFFCKSDLLAKYTYIFLLFLNYYCKLLFTYDYYHEALKSQKISDVHKTNQK